MSRDPAGNKYNELDPLGVLAHEEDLERKLTEPNEIQKYIEANAIKKDEARKFRLGFRLERPTYAELSQEFAEIVVGLLGMVVTTEAKGQYVKGRIIDVNSGMVKIETRGKKDKMWIDFQECLKLKNNYD